MDWTGNVKMNVYATTSTEFEEDDPDAFDVKSEDTIVGVIKNGATSEAITHEEDSLRNQNCAEVGDITLAWHLQ